MRKRERENPCGVCGHYHKFEEGEVCGVCGHRAPAAIEPLIPQGSAFPSEILRDFLFLGSYDNASRNEILKTLGITRILNTVPACQNLYKNSFTYHCLQDDKVLQFDEAIQFLDQCEKEKARVLVHCMWGKNRSAAVVVAYIMKCKGWRLAQSYQWVKDRRPVVELSSAIHQQLLEYESRIFGNCDLGPGPLQPIYPLNTVPSFGFGYTSPTNNISQFPAFSQPATTSIFERISPNYSANEFVFGAGRNTEQKMMENNSVNMVPPTGNEAPMDSS